MTVLENVIWFYIDVGKCCTTKKPVVSAWFFSIHSSLLKRGFLVQNLFLGGEIRRVT